MTVKAVVQPTVTLRPAPAGRLTRVHEMRRVAERQDLLPSLRVYERQLDHTAEVW
jgi:hypothetical protein